MDVLTKRQPPSILEIQRHYDNVSKAYDCELNEKFYRFFAAALVGDINKAGIEFNNALEMGCGSGFSTLELVKRMKPGDISAIDISKSMLDRASKKEKLSGVNFFKDLAELKRGKFDLIFSSFSYHWWDSSLTKKLAGMLSKNGLIALCIPARRPELLTGNLLIAKAIKKLSKDKDSSNEKMAGLIKKKIVDDFSAAGNWNFNFDTIKLTEQFSDVNKFVETLDVRGSILALSRYYGFVPEEFNKELMSLSRTTNQPIEISWKAYSVFVTPILHRISL